MFLTSWHGKKLKHTLKLTYTLFQIKLIGDVMNLIRWICVIYYLLLLRATTGPNFNFIPHMKAEISEGGGGFVRPPTLRNMYGKRTLRMKG